MMDNDSSYKRLRIFVSCVAIVLGALDAWSGRFSMDPDGISYLDMGDAYLRGDWHMAINAFWSPLYAWCLGFFLKVLKPSPYWEFPVVHLVNFLLYLVALASFDFFLRWFIDHQKKSEKGAVGGEEAVLPEWAWWILGYSLFISSSLELITIRLVTPDMCVAALVYLAAGLVLKIRSGNGALGTFALLGVVLGFAYLAKAVMFPLGFVILAVAAFSYGNFRKAVPRVLISTVVFLAIAGLFIAAISEVKGRLTFGDSGRWNYVVFVDGVQPLFPESTALRHPAVKVFDKPAAYEFANVNGGTFPPWYDPSYWQEGIQPYFNIRGQMRVVAGGLVRYFMLFFGFFWQVNVTVGLFVLYLIAPRPSRCLDRAATNWPLLIPALAALGSYSLLIVQYRYVAPFVCLLWLVGFSGVRLPPIPESKKLIAVMVIFVAATSGALAIWSTFASQLDRRNSDPVYWKAARAMEQQGIRAGDKIALIWNEKWWKGFAEGPFVPRLAKVQVIAEVSQPNVFWAATASTRSQVVKALQKTGAKAILMRGAQPVSVPELPWKRLGETDYYLCVFKDLTL